MSELKINEDGSMKGTSFTEKFGNGKYEGDYPRPMDGEETYSEYHERVNAAKEKGFHLGDLSWSDWSIYCKGSGSYDDFDENKII